VVAGTVVSSTDRRGRRRGCGAAVAEGYQRGSSGNLSVATARRGRTNDGRSGAVVALGNRLQTRRPQRLLPGVGLVDAVQRDDPG